MTDKDKRITYFTMIDDNLGKYVEIHCDHDVNPRDIMHRRYGSKWGFQYDTKEEAGVERFNLKLKDIIRR